MLAHRVPERSDRGTQFLANPGRILWAQHLANLEDHQLARAIHLKSVRQRSGHDGRALTQSRRQVILDASII
jgi:hypothetical protein